MIIYDWAKSRKSTLLTAAGSPSSQPGSPRPSPARHRISTGAPSADSSTSSSAQGEFGISKGCCVSCMLAVSREPGVQPLRATDRRSSGSNGSMTCLSSPQMSASSEQWRDTNTTISATVSHGVQSPGECCNSCWRTRRSGGTLSR